MTWYGEGMLWLFSTLQFRLRFGLIGLVYFGLTATYGIGTVVAGPITAKLVSICDVKS